MTAVAERIGRFTPGSPEWHTVRATGLGGSEIAAVMGLSPWESRFSLWHRKAGLIGAQEDTPGTRRGNYLEDAIATWFADEHPEQRVRRTGTWRHKARPWQIANPDRLITGPGGREVLEIKTSARSDGWGTPGTDEIPVYYRCQVLWYLDTLGLDTCRVAALIGLEYREYVVRYDVVDAIAMREAAEEFLASLASGDRPDIDEHGATYQVVRDFHPDIDDTEVEISEQLADEYAAAVLEHKLAEAHKRQLTSAVLDAMGSARRATCDGESIAIRVPGRGDAAPTLRPSPIRPKEIAA